MTNKTALMVAYNILIEELDRAERQEGLEPDDPYCIEIKTAAEKIQQMMDAC